MTNFRFGKIVSCLVIVFSSVFNGPLISEAQTSCTIPGATNSAYLLDMKERFHRNLPDSFSLPEDVTVRFFLTAGGLVKDASIAKSSGYSNLDLACIDAVYSASPLPAPPIMRTVLKPPPEAFLYRPEDYGEGVYTFTFNKKSALASLEAKSSIFQLHLIPNEVLFRYPGLFKASELSSSSNQLFVNADPYFLECLRSPWSLLYKNTDAPSKQEIIELSRSIVQKYIDKK